jgi:hypothetical protein
LGIPQDVKIVLVTFGGIQSRRRLQLPTMAGVHWLLPPDYSTLGHQATNVSKIDMSFIDVLASSDAVVTKVGYCTFVEAACNGVGLVSAPRNDWPESGNLIEWAKQNGNFSLADIEDTDELRAALTTVLESSSDKQAIPSGTAESVDIIEAIANITYMTHGPRPRGGAPQNRLASRPRKRRPRGMAKGWHPTPHYPRFHVRS